MPDRALGDRDVQQAGTPQAVTVGASPFSYANQSGRLEVLYFSQPAGATTTVARGGVTIASILTPAATTIPITVFCPPGATMVFTYSAGAPTMARDTV